VHTVQFRLEHWRLLGSVGVVPCLTWATVALLVFPLTRLRIVASDMPRSTIDNLHERRHFRSESLLNFTQSYNCMFLSIGVLAPSHGTVQFERAGALPLQNRAGAVLVSGIAWG
jgi:hypothetical protein